MQGRTFQPEWLTDTEYPTAVSWNGLVLGGYVRNSSWIQRDNNRAEFQLVQMGQYAKARGYAVRWFEELGVSGTRMHRRVMLQTLLGLIAKGEIHGIFCADISRLSRDERLLDPLFIADMLRQHAEGRLLTCGGELDLRRSDDLRRYTILAQIASAQRRDTLTAASQGYSVAVQKVLRGDRPIFRKGKVMIGYRRVPALDQDGYSRCNSNGRIITTFERNLGDAPALAALSEEFDRQPTLTAVVCALHRRGIVGPSHATDGYTWTGRLVREILNDPLYAGVWTANRSSSAAGHLANADCLTIANTEFAVPHLAWWQSSQMGRWRTKFLSHENVARTQRQSVPHPLLGLALCAGCGAFLGAFGAKADAYARRVTYRCPNRMRGCPQRTLLTEGPMLRAMAQHLPNILEQTARAACAAQNHFATDNDGGVDARLAALTQRERFIRENWPRRLQVPPAWLLDEIQELANASIQLEKEKATSASELDLLRVADELLASLHAGRIAEFMSETPERQAAVWRRLVSQARFTVGGTSGRGRIVTAELTPIAEQSQHQVG